jgi:hypothetical protein
MKLGLERKGNTIFEIPVGHKHSSLFDLNICEGENDFLRVVPVANVIILFTTVIYDFS